MAMTKQERQDKMGAARELCRDSAGTATTLNKRLWSEGPRDLQLDSDLLKSIVDMYQEAFNHMIALLNDRNALIAQCVEILDSI